MDIDIVSPIGISIDVVEFDERIPLMKFIVKVFVEKFECSISVNTACWVECAAFDSFLGQLKLGGEAKFQDINKDFSLWIDVEKSRLIWSCIKRDVAGNTMGANGEEFLIEGAIDRILEAFESYPQWW